MNNNRSKRRPATTGSWLAFLYTVLLGCGSSGGTDGPGTSTHVATGARSPAPVTAPAPSMEPFDIGMVTFVGYAPLYLAKERGYFGDLDVRLRRIEEIPALRAGMAEKDLEAYLATPDIAFDTNAPPLGRAVWALDESSGGDGVAIVSDDKGIVALKGKKVAAEPGLPPSFVLMYLLHQNGMTMKDIALQDMPTQAAAAAFASGAVDAAGLYEPYLSSSVKQRRGAKVALSSAQVPGLIVDLVFAREDVVEHRSDALMRVAEGFCRALADIQKDRDGSFVAMAKAFGQKPAEFADAAGGVKWLGAAENKALFGTAQSHGPLFESAGKVVEVLKKNRPSTFDSVPEVMLTTSVVERVK